MTVENWTAIWLASRSDLRPTTLDRADGAVRNHIIPELGRIPIGDLERLRVQQWAGGLSRALGPASVRKIVNVLSGALQLAVDDGYLPSNPAVRLKLPKLSTKRKRFLSHAQVSALAEEVLANSVGAGYGLLALV
ncbi:MULTISPECIES: N-terminal phage integrase SAM-like domain-containing protein [Cryobacterium]|uniref:N-terminal phage integrase SAM-like domain-containing protein n=1 Tax=Cryobacterium TaxID=69578 RepID=UPI00141A690C|nr:MULTISPECIES: N-terminal phage integrase SAM-like domain-containing protein [Cryobacterium]